ncbi:MAG TPA: flagellin, partial [Mycobacterium sp.]|nr:flagellin [Mycobacterium sp.]
ATVVADIDTALDTVNSQRATLGATQNRFDAVISNLQVAYENQTAARSRIMDADFAVETSNLSRAQILQQAGNAMVAQANQLPQQVLSLLKG